jgi:uncharacterized metal-binding protein
VRLIYFSLWLALCGGLVWGITLLLRVPWQPLSFLPLLETIYHQEMHLWLFVGLELGSLSHSLGDLLSSGYKRLFKS